MRAICFPLDDLTRFDPFDFGTDDDVVFVGSDRAMVGIGVAATADLAHIDTLLASIACDDQIAQPGSGVVAHGSLPFTSAVGSQLIVPRISVVRETHGRSWATLVADGDEFDYATLDDLLAGARTSSVPASSAKIHAALFRPDPALFEAAVAEAVTRIEKGELGKVVLSRGVDVELDQVLSCLNALRRLHGQEPLCTAFSYPVAGGRFLGASPELMVSVMGTVVRCHPLAGTVGLTGQRAHDEAAVSLLASSDKIANEHRYVVDEIARSLAPWCDAVSYPSTPSVVHLHSVAHLGTEMEATLKSPTSVTVLMAELHPTPAVGGVPRPEALRAIAALEPEPRGQWAGPVGWVDAAGNGEWFIGIRSATVRADGRSVHLHAGAGIVAGSDPSAELAETSIKLAPLVDAIAPGATLPSP